MAQKVPPEGIQAYMDNEAVTLTPPNWLWKIQNWFGRWLFEGWGGLLVITLFILMIVASMIGGEVESWMGSLIHTPIGVAIVGSIVVGIGARRPGDWVRYSLYALKHNHPELYEKVAKVSGAVRLRDPRPDIEFEVAVLEWKGKTYGMVLFQVLGLPPNVPEKVVQVFMPEGQPVEFGSMRECLGPVSWSP